MKPTLSAAQREVLQDAVRNRGDISRWDVDSARLRTLSTLVNRKYLRNAGGGWYTITPEGRKAL